MDIAVTLKRVARSEVLWRIAAAVLGGYVFCWGLIALMVAGLFALGGEFHDGEMLGSIIGLLAYLAAFLWAFCAQDLRRVSLVLAVGGAAMAGLASLIQHFLLT